VVSGNTHTWAEAKDEASRLNAQQIEQEKRAAEKREQDRWFAIHGVPSEKSLKSLDAKLAAIRKAEAIENGSEEL